MPPRYQPANDEWAMDDEAIAADRKVRDYKLKDGRNELRFLALKGKGKYYQPYAMHFGVGPENRTFACPRNSPGGGGPCVACDYVFSLYEDGTEASKKEANRIRAKERYVSVVIDMKAAQPEPMSLPYGSQIFQGIEEVRSIPSVGNPFHPEAGQTLYVTKTAKGSNKWEVEYRVLHSGEKSAIADMAWMDRAVEIVDKYIQFPDQEEVKAYLYRKAPAEPAPNRPFAELARQATQQASRTVPDSAPQAPAQSWGGRPATDPQIKAAYAIARDQGMTDEDLDEFSGELFELPVQELNRRQASQLIDALKGTVGTTPAEDNPATTAYNEEAAAGEELPEDEEDEYAQEPPVAAAAPARSGGGQARFTNRLRALQR